VCQPGPGDARQRPDLTLVTPSHGEPAPAPTARELFPDVIAAKPRFLCFLFFVLQAG